MKTRALALVAAAAITVTAAPALPAATAAPDQLADLVTFNEISAAATQGRNAQGAPQDTVDPHRVLTNPRLEDVIAVVNDPTRDRIVLATTGTPTLELRRTIHRLYGSQAAVTQAPANLRPTSRDADTTPFTGGAAIGNYGAEHLRCTSGFSWTTSAGEPALLTAGHCYPAGSNQSVATNAIPGFRYWAGRATHTTVNSSGTIGLSGDLAVIDVQTTPDGTRIDRTSQGRMFVGGPTSTTTVPVTGVQPTARLGSSVCYSSAVLGEECGPIDADGHGGYTVIDTAFAYRSADGRIWTNLALALKDWGYCIRGGESGSPVYLPAAGGGVSANGIVNGGGGGDVEQQFVPRSSPTENCLLTFTPIGNASALWGGSVQTAG